MNITQKELADKLGVAVGTIQQYELDKREPKFEMILRLASALATKPYNLYGIEEDTTEFDFRKACEWLEDAGFEISRPDTDDGLQQYYIDSPEDGTICKKDKIDIINLVDSCLKEANEIRDEIAIKNIQKAIQNQK